MSLIGMSLSLVISACALLLVVSMRRSWKAEREKQAKYQKHVLSKISEFEGVTTKLGRSIESVHGKLFLHEQYLKEIHSTIKEKQDSKPSASSFRTTNEIV